MSYVPHVYSFLSYVHQKIQKEIQLMFSQNIRGRFYSLRDSMKGVIANHLRSIIYPVYAVDHRANY
jgi:hypothetical protein